MKTPVTHSFAAPGEAPRYTTCLCLVLPLMVALGLGGCGGSREQGAMPNNSQNNSLPVHCLNEPDPGPCKAFVARYFYDYRHDLCRIFWYRGCLGRVPFETLAVCEKTCLGGNP